MDNKKLVPPFRHVPIDEHNKEEIIERAVLRSHKLYRNSLLIKMLVVKMHTWITINVAIERKTLFCIKTS